MARDLYSQAINLTIITDRDTGREINRFLVVVGQDYLHRADVVHGDFRNPLPYDWESIYTRGDSQAYALRDYGTYRWKTSCIGYATKGNTVIFDTGLYNSCVSALYEKVRGSLDLSVDIAQARETKRMFHFGDKLSELVRSKGPRGLLKSISSSYLEFQYGWEPLIGDVYAAADTWRNRVAGLVSKVDVRKTRKGSEIRPLAWEGQGLAGVSPNWLYETHRAYKESCRIKCYLDLSDYMGVSNFSSMNPVSIAWELVPYSFVIDWFYNIGGYIRDLESYLLYSGLPVRGFETIRYGRDDRQIVPGIYPLPDGIIRFEKGLVDNNQLYSRTTSQQFPLPMRPTFNVGLSSHRLLNAAALLANLIKR